MRAILSFLWDLLYFLSGEGTWCLRPHERLVLEAAIANFPDDMQKQLRAQLNQKIFVQRSHRQISRPRFYSPFYVPNKEMYANDEFLHTLVSVKIDVEGERENAHIEFFRGRIDSIQFKYSGTFYRGKAVKVLGVKSGKPGLSHAAAIDRAEHGSQNQDVP
ncbi:hypothetical protein [Rheinheimera sp. 1928-s]|uniref:hypothetical protein n=1 Tax=Rheinheimera sp. 1928-s TaxID=3033803 RepID=UPI0026185B00|nr:hypothetical protein [Rheinheimera sp. 1928-s]MDF3127210.1 hypothetical protein [Rheinheimera sp. 1928-s]